MAVDLGVIDINKRFGGNMVDQNYINQMLAKKAAMQQVQEQIKATKVPEYDNPYRKNALGMGLASLAMGIGEGMTGRPFLTSFNNNMHEQKQAQLKYKQWQEEQQAKAAEDASQAELRAAQTDYYKAGATGVGAGGLVPDGMEVTGYDPRGRPILRKSEDIKAAEASRRQAVKAYQTYAPDAFKVLQSIDELRASSKELGDFGRGIIPQTWARGKMALQDYTKSNPALNKYVSTVSEKLIPLARKLMEEKGPITEWDVKRVEKALGDKTLPLADKMEIFSRLENSVKEAVMFKRSMIDDPDGELDAFDAKITGKTKSDPEYDAYLKAIGSK